MGVALDAEDVLHAALGGQAVVVPAHGIGDVLAQHALIAHQEVLMSVREHVAYVQRTGHRGRRAVHDKGLLSGAGRIVAVNAPLLPLPAPTLFCFPILILFGNLFHKFLQGKPRSASPAIYTNSIICRMNRRKNGFSTST